ENTRCPTCQATVIERTGYLIRAYRLGVDGRCPHCQTRLPGVWPGAGGSVKTGNDRAAYQSRLPRPVPLGTGQQTAQRAAPRQAPRQGLPFVSAPAPPPPGGTPHMPPPTPTLPAPPAAPHRPSLADEHRQQVLDAVSRLLRNLVAGQPAVFPA